MMVNIQILDDYKEKVSLDYINIAVEAVVSHCGIDESDMVSIVIDNDQTLRDLNRNFLGIDHITDVLSFESNEIDPETENNYIGDIIISYPTAYRQAEKQQHHIDYEIQLLVIHGFLHLLGFDHDTRDNKNEMWEIQRTILKDINSPVQVID